MRKEWNKEKLDNSLCSLTLTFTWGSPFVMDPADGEWLHFCVHFRCFSLVRAKNDLLNEDEKTKIINKRTHKTNLYHSLWQGKEEEEVEEEKWVQPFIFGHLSSSNVCWCLSALLGVISLLFRQLRSIDFSIVQSDDREAPFCSDQKSIAFLNTRHWLVRSLKQTNLSIFSRMTMFSYRTWFTFQRESRVFLSRLTTVSSSFRLFFPHHEVANLWTQAFPLLFGDLCLGHCPVHSIRNLLLRGSSTAAGWFRVRSQYHWYKRLQR